MRCFLLAVAMLAVSAGSRPVLDGPSDFTVDRYGQTSYPAWPYLPCGDGPFTAEIEIRRSVYASDSADFVEGGAGSDLGYSVVVKKIDSNAWAPANSNITVGEGPLQCAESVEYWIVSGLEPDLVVFPVGDPGHGSRPVTLYNSATHVTRTWTIQDPWDEAIIEFAPFHVPNDPALIGLSVYHQAFIVYRGSNGFFGVLSSDGLEVTLER